MAFFGTPALSVPTLQCVDEGPHDVVCVVSQPDRGRGRGRKTRPSPVSAFAMERGLPLLRPEKVGSPETVQALRDHAPDVGVVVAYGQFIPRTVRELPSRGYLLNAHASLLPELRGAAPIARAILAGHVRTGVSVMRIEREMDAGAVALVRELEIGPDENTGALEERMGTLAAEAIALALEQVANGTLQWCEQDHSRATEAPKLDRRAAVLDWNEPAAALVLRVRAFAPKPGATTTLANEPLRVLEARATDGPTDRPPGRVKLDTSDREAPLRIATAEGWLVPLRLQPMTVGKASLDVVTLADGFGDRDAAVMTWLRRSADAVAGLLGQFPVDDALLLMVGDADRRGSFGFTVRGGGPTATLLMPAAPNDEHLAGDWTAVHELLHFALPPLPTEDAWLYEGVVTYLTAVARARAGIITPEYAWWELLDGFRRGRKVGTGVTLRKEAASMHDSHAYWRVYWAGAAMALSMDLELRRRNKTLAGTVAALAESYPDASRDWNGAQVMQRLDGHCGSTIPSDTMNAHVDETTFPDTNALANKLGVRLAKQGKTVVYDNAAPDANICAAIMK